MRIGLCDDDTLHLNYIHNFTKKYLNDNMIDIIPLSPEQLFNQIETGLFDYDILVTDIDMGNQNGIQLAKGINQNNPNCIIIYVSSYLNYATQVCETNHVYFVLKQELEAMLPKALDKAIAIYLTSMDNIFVFKYQGVTYSLHYKDIICFESKGRYITLSTVTKTYTFIGTLKHTLTCIPDYFCKCHNSFIINLNHVLHMNKTECNLTNNLMVPISKSYSKSLENQYISYLTDSKLLSL